MASLLPSAVSADYISWNARLFDFALRESIASSEFSNECFFLTVSTFLDAQSDNDAKAAFICSVRETYTALLKFSRDPISALTNSRDAKGNLLCVAFLGLSVLAAEKMDDNTYYLHLAHLLDQELEAKGDLPIGFDRSSFEDAWQALNVCLVRRGFRMEEPPVNGKRFVRWPQMHALLRQTDLAKLPRFFREGGFRPSRSVSADSVKNCFTRWGIDNLTPAGQRAWENPLQRPAIVQQILRALEQWDERVPEPNSPWGCAWSPFHLQRFPVRLVIDLDRGNASLFLRVPRPTEFPTDFRFPDLPASHIKAVRLQAQADDDFYQNATLPADWAQMLARGIGMESRTGNKCLTLKAAPFYLFQQSEWEDWETCPYLRVGLPGMVLCTAAAAPHVQRFLDAICCPYAKKMPLDRTFPGWTLFHTFRPTEPHVATIGQNVLEARSGCLLRPIGGLRLGRKQEWLHGAPPEYIECVGRKPDFLQINEATSTFVEHKDTEKDRTSWRASVAAHLTAPGDCTIWAGQERYRFCLVPANMPDVSNDVSNDEVFDFWEEPPFLIPISPTEKISVLDTPSVSPSLVSKGRQHLIGPCPWQTARSETEATWILTDCDNHASVIALSPCPPLPQTPPSYLFKQARYLPLLEAWAEGILRFAPARIGFWGCESHVPNKAHIARQWRKYVEQAAWIRRRLAPHASKPARIEKWGR